jgi:hypothetical protein
LPDLLALGLLLDRSDKVSGDFIIDVCFEQRQSNLAQRRVDVLLGQDTFAPQVLQRPL